ncbi:MAG: hypothetical protein KBS86_02065 [Proteobacteria bacterium]|nr:hypothetical protein [Candidatus Enterousia scatequi]
MPTDIKKRLLLIASQNAKGCTAAKIKKLNKKISDLQKQADKIQSDLFLNRSALEFCELKKRGFSDAKIKSFATQDAKLCSDAQTFIKDNANLVKRFFGYHLNLIPESAAVKYMRYLETKIRSVDNCGDTYEDGFFHLTCKHQEQKILDLLYEHFGISHADGAWGYLTSGGSESNRWGIENGVQMLNGGRVYFSAGAHYSVPKAVQLGPMANAKQVAVIPHTVIETEKDSEKINVDSLISAVSKNWREKHEPAVILLTWGTTKTGALDDVETVIKRLDELKIPRYIHLDAALYGGLGNGQKNAPEIPTFKKFDIDSISVSMHKYFGSHEIKSAVIARKKPFANSVDYISMTDSTTAGSRGLAPFSTYQRISEIFNRKDANDYNRNIEYFEKMLKANHIWYKRQGFANIFVIKCPSDAVCHKYELSTFCINGKSLAHIMIFPFHKRKFMQEIISDIK